MKYTVHLYHAVRIRMEDVEAESQEEAVTKAMEDCDVKNSLVHGAFEDDEGRRLQEAVGLHEPVSVEDHALAPRGGERVDRGDHGALEVHVVEGQRR